MKNLVLGIGIVIIYALALWQGVEAFYPSPKYDEFCTPGRFEYPVPAKPYSEADVSCNSSRSLQEQENSCYKENGQPIYEYNEKGCPIGVKECDFCNKEFEKANDKYSKVVFIIAIIIGIITLIIGYGVLSIEPVGSALMASGIWSIFWGAAINWRNFSNIWRFLLLFVALVLIIWFALRLNTSKKKNFWEKLGLRK